MRAQWGYVKGGNAWITVCAVWVHLVSDHLILGVHGGKMLSGRVALSVAIGRFGSGAFAH